ncbi:hypothetical protein EBB59_09065 [Lysobacter pythonis]|uniref:Regulator SirB n=1 Tax=Solilutibacter pythonis TaxID=2483112 RepID=A0A3M2HPG7_9GAMM|nr:SirB2 family protein [Lysobacter pythonis]RMH90918.1 hypothetical protein EBB59_09065 [Lysobacter pythonis]
MIEFYPQIKSAHVHLVMSSVALFALRGGFSLFSARWPRHAAARYASYAIDTALLTSGAMLLTILPGALFANGWLAVKLGLLVVYVVFGILSMRASFPRARRLGFYLAALATVFWMYGIARLHHPLGWALRWFG